MKQFILITCLFLISCSQDGKDWRNATRYYKCTKEQMDRVEHEANWCRTNAGYGKAYCYGSAIIRNCEPNSEIKKEGER